ncbi:anti-repressor SinI family protein [Ectobacillus sp. JY-23]|nr:anti-repressor SinI family protein [Ectobacillus sp. JY-23]UOY94376.1 anti-repressor SinI family protein [Ectobacillus sp. JY-23]
MKQAQPTAVHQENNLDQEWLDLMIEAIDMGISAEEVRKFLSNVSM